MRQLTIKPRSFWGLFSGPKETDYKLGYGRFDLKETAVEADTPIERRSLVLNTAQAVMDLLVIALGIPAFDITSSAECIAGNVVSGLTSSATTVDSWEDIAAIIGREIVKHYASIGACLGRQLVKKNVSSLLSILSNINIVFKAISAATKIPFFVDLFKEIVSPRDASYSVEQQVDFLTYIPAAKARVSNISGLTVSFSGSGTDPDPQEQSALSYHWDFGDGEESYSQNPTHAYAKSGSYTVTLTVKDPWGSWATDTVKATVRGGQQSAQGKIAFASDRDGNDEIYVMNADGSNQHRLTDNPTRDWDPAWSPDGMKIAFVSYRDGNAEIYVMNADGSNQHRLTNSPTWDWFPAWSPVLP